MNSAKSMRHAYLRLCSIAFVVFVLWTWILPRISDLDVVRNRIEKNRAAGINPTAVFYTDHPGMSSIERNIAARVEHPNKSFWQISRR